MDKLQKRGFLVTPGKGTDCTPAPDRHFPALDSDENRPVLLENSLVFVNGDKYPAPAVTIYSLPEFAPDASGAHSNELLAVVTLTRSEIASILKSLDDDYAALGGSFSKDPTESHI